MSQHVAKPTRGNNMLDLVFSTNENIIESCEVVQGMSDHDAVLTTIDLKPARIKQKPRTVYTYSKINMDNDK